jgi:hypothetical protein
MRVCEKSAALLFYEEKWYNFVVMMMDDYKISENFQGGAGCKMISPHHFHPTNGVCPSDSSKRRIERVAPL